MPILDIEIVLRENESLPPDLPQIIADRVGEIFGSGPGGTWVRVHPIDPGHYAENATGPDELAYPVFVSILKVDLPPPSRIQAEITRLTEGLASACHRPPENIHIIYLPDGRGRVAFGGKLLK